MARLIFGGNWHVTISVAASIVCLGTLNAWVLTSGQIASGAAADGHLPKLFAETNSRGAPTWGLTISSLGVVPMLIVTLNQNMITTVNMIIDVSVTAFLFIYALSTLSYLKLFSKNGITDICIGLGALSFCGWALYSAGIKMVSLAALIPLIGFPLYLWKKRSAKKQSLAD